MRQANCVNTATVHPLTRSLASSIVVLAPSDRRARNACDVAQSFDMHRTNVADSSRIVNFISASGESFVHE